MRRVAVFFLSVLLLSAHEPGLSTTSCEIDDRTIRLTVGISSADLPSLAPAADETGLLRAAPSLWSVSGANGPLAVREQRVTRDPENGLVLQLAFDRPTGASVRLRFAAFGRLPGGHRDYFSWADSAGQVRAAQLLDAQHPAITLALPAADSAPPPTEWWRRRQVIVGTLAALAGLLWLRRRRR